MTFDIAGATHTGHVRRHNEDAFGIDQALPAAVLADGMGGLAQGEVASTAVVDGVLGALRNGRSAEAALHDVHADIIGRGSGAQRMGSTAVIVTIDGGRAVIHWVGDSRAYLFRNGALQALTRDHSLVQNLLDAGAITAAEAERHPNRNVVTRAVGVRDSGALQVDRQELELQPGDRLLVCSDGLHGFLPEHRIAAILREQRDSRSAADALIAATLDETAAGDNVTAVCVSLG